MRNIILKTLKKSSYLAMFVAVLSANTTCTWIVHQPSMPKDLKKLKKVLQTKRKYDIISELSVEWSSGVVVNMLPCHGGDRGFESHLDRHFCRCSSMVEHSLAKADTGVRFPSFAPVISKSL